MPFHNGVIRAHINFGWVFKPAFGRRNILGNIDDDGPRATRLGDVERLFHRHGDILDVLDQEVMLDAMSGHTNGIDFLKGILTDIGSRHLPREHNQGNRIHISRRNARHGVGRARSGSHQRHADPAGRSCQSIGRVYGALLMPGQNMANPGNLILLEKFVI